MTPSQSGRPIAHTHVVDRLLSDGLPDSAAADLIFLEAWELDPQPGIAAARRVGQIRRAQPAIANAIRAELERWKKEVARLR